MKILIVSDAWYPQLNGVVRTYEYLMEELVDGGHDVKVIGPADFPVVVPMPGYAEIKLAMLPHRRLRRLIKEYNPDHLHIATEGPLGWAARRYALKNKLDFTSSYHTQFPDYISKRVHKIIPLLSGFTRKRAISMMKKFHDPARALLIATASLEEQLKGWNFAAPMARLTRGVDMAIFKPGAQNLFQDLKRPVAIYVGRIAIEKSIEDFLEMEWDGSKVVVGHGPDLDYLKNKYPQATFTGKKVGKELADHYRSADVFVFPSRTDTFGIVLIEALACGLPVAAYNVTGPKDIITENYLGVLDEDLAAAAKKALTCGTAQQRFDHIKNNYTWEEAARQFLTAASA
jgi:glycosyltransferase involved in cell wall biosynthesis